MVGTTDDGLIQTWTCFVVQGDNRGSDKTEQSLSYGDSGEIQADRLLIYETKLFSMVSGPGGRL